MPKRKNVFAPVLTLIFLALVVGLWLGWSIFIKSNVPADLSSEYVMIPTGSGLEEVVTILKNNHFIIDEASFRRTASQMDYKGRAGRFKIKSGWSNYHLVRQLRSGKQSPVKVILVNERLPEDIAGKVAGVIEADSLSILTLLKDRVFLDSLGYTPETAISMFIPNTYELFWNTSARRFLARMQRENESFWQNDDRLENAEKKGLTKEEIYTLASIVERETNDRNEMPRIAGLYLNRLRVGMPLQADPTLVFASRDWESRSLSKYKILDSPYNTYRYPGLPPGPISMASIVVIDAVLNADDHDYLYMCAIGDGSGKHSFAATYNAHLVNIRRYKQNLIQRGLGL